MNTTRHHHTQYTDGEQLALFDVRPYVKGVK